MKDNENFNFHISGIPANEEIEIQDTAKKSVSGRSNFKMPSVEDLKNFSKQDMETIKKSIPPEMNNIISMLGMTPESMINNAISMLENMNDSDIESIINTFNNELNGNSMCSANCNSCSKKDSSEPDIDTMFPTGNPKFLFPEEFGIIECQSSDNLYEEFVSVYGNDSTKYLDDNIGLRNFILNGITAKLNFDHIKNMRFVNSNKNFILFYMEPEQTMEDCEEYGFYAAVVKLPDNSFALYIPTYCNTFDLFDENDGDYDVTLFNEEDNPYAFSAPASEITSFQFLAANLIEFAVSFALSPVKKVLLSPNEFGTIKPARASITADSSFFPIGKITSNGSTSATLLLKDAELPLNSESYNIFMKFPKVVDEHMLRFLSGIMFNVDFNNCELLKNVELKFTQDGKLYFDVDHLGNF